MEQDLFDINVSFDNTTPINHTNLLWKLGLGLGVPENRTSPHITSLWA